VNHGEESKKSSEENQKSREKEQEIREEVLLLPLTHSQAARLERFQPRSLKWFSPGL